MPKQLAEQPEFPEELRYVWDYYIEMRGMEPLSFTEMQSWANLTHNVLTSWDVELVKALDRLYWRMAGG